MKPGRRAASFLLTFVLALVLVAAPAFVGVAAAEDLAAQDLGGGVFLLAGGGGNVALLTTPEGALLVDTLTLDGARTLPDRIRRLTDKPVRYVVNTHSHFDHIEGNALFLGTATLIAHDAAARREAAFHAEVLREYPGRLEAARQKKDEGGSGWAAGRLEWARQSPAGRAPVPTLTFGSDLTLSLGDETVRLWHLGPGHTDGDTLVYFEKAKVLHLGDLDFHQIIPYMAASEGTNVPSWIAALDEVQQRVPPDVKVIPGHGALTDLPGLRPLRGYLADLLEAARQAKARGLSQEEFSRSVSLPAYAAWAGYAERFKDNAAFAYATLR